MKIAKRFLLPILVLLTIYTFHDMESAQGIGFYFYLKTGALSRTAWEIIIDVIVVLFIAVVLLVWMRSTIPVTGATQSESVAKRSFFDNLELFFDALITYLVFVPIVPVNYFHALIFSHSDLPSSLDVTALTKRNLLNLGLTFIALLIVKSTESAVKSRINGDLNTADSGQKNCKKRAAITDNTTSVTLICLGILITVISILIPQIQKLLFYIFHLIVSFLIFKVTQREKIDSDIYTGFLIITAVFKLIQTTAMF